MSYRKANGLNEFYSKGYSNSERIEVFVDRFHMPTMTRPHAHVIHHGSGDVEVVATDMFGNHVWKTRLSYPSGTEVNQAVDEAWSRL
jgi:hypothetical protein